MDVPVALLEQEGKDGEVGVETSPAASEPKRHAWKQRAKAEEFWEYIILDKKPHVSMLTEEEQGAVPRNAQHWISAGHKTCLNLSALHDGKVSEAWVHFSYDQKRLFVIGQYYADQNMYLLKAKKGSYAPLLARIPPTMHDLQRRGFLAGPRHVGSVASLLHDGWNIGEAVDRLFEHLVYDCSAGCYRRFGLPFLSAEEAVCLCGDVRPEAYAAGAFHSAVLVPVFEAQHPGQAANQLVGPIVSFIC